MCGVSAEKIIHVEGGISPTGQFDSKSSAERPIHTSLTLIAKCTKRKMLDLEPYYADVIELFCLETRD